ncbi:MAG: hypothetical protein A3D39_03500 [Candidatus Buchananbacteria bacterium RIFCSPHIGHO2_02_FULL_39_17]|nr:MAG: hypothetical protein A3D39_03500 [Candidatus Buchananbacteria bacterium RIFCSPHIGHO2_02_FULL_39_17]
MTNTKISIPAGLKALHSFDVYGVILNTEQLGEQSIAHFRQIAPLEQIPDDQTTKTIDDYRALIQGQPWTTGELKRGIIEAIKKPLAKYPDLKVNYQQAMYQDCLQTMDQLLNCNERVMLFSSLDAEWIKKELPSEIASRLTATYGQPKIKPEAWQQVEQIEFAKGNYLVSHTADELPELEAAIASGIFTQHNGRLIFVNRNNQITPAQARNAGIEYYVNDLREVPYTKLVRK